MTMVLCGVLYAYGAVWSAVQYSMNMVLCGELRDCGTVSSTIWLWNFVENYLTMVLYDGTVWNTMWCVLSAALYPIALCGYCVTMVLCGVPYDNGTVWSTIWQWYCLEYHMTMVLFGVPYDNGTMCSTLPGGSPPPASGSPPGVSTGRRRRARNGPLR
jgi:hypothetical protein